MEAAKKSLKAAQSREKEAKKQADLTKKKNQEERAVLSSIGGNLVSQFRPEKSPLKKEISGLRKEASKFISTYKKTRPKDAKQMERVSKHSWPSRATHPLDTLSLSTSTVLTRHHGF